MFPLTDVLSRNIPVMRKVGEKFLVNKKKNYTYHSITDLYF